MTPELRHACERAVHVIKADGSILKAGKAALFVLDRIGYTPLLRIFGYPPLLWFVNIGYYTVAKNRPFFAHFLFTKELPPPQDDEMNEETETTSVATQADTSESR